MTTEELIQAFPECEKIKRDDIAECITKAMTEERFYTEASDKVCRKAYELWKYQRGLKDDDPERVAYRAYFWGDILEGVESPFKEWLKTFKTEFIAQHGQVEGSIDWEQRIYEIARDFLPSAAVSVNKNTQDWMDGMTYQKASALVAVRYAEALVEELKKRAKNGSE